jgi:ceramide glucosyltransferase
MTMLADLAALSAFVGILSCLAGWIAILHFAARPPVAPVDHPPVTILKPLCGEEPQLEEALASCCSQDYPIFQIVFGLHHRCDPALAVVERLQARFPDCDIAVVIEPALHGSNRKVSNLINMLPSAKYDVLVISDSDLHVPSNYLERLVAELEKPGTGLVTSVSFGLPPAECGWPSKLGATQISYNYLPGILLSRALGRQDCLGSTAMLRRETLDRTGGLYPLVQLLAEDNVLGQRVRGLGLSVGLADTAVAATVPEPSLSALWRHEVRWTRTIRASAPLALAGSVLQYPLFWATMACIFSAGDSWSLALLGGTWFIRVMAMRGIDSVLRQKMGQLAPAGSIWLIPVRDILSVIEIGASYWVENVTWRGHKMDANGIVSEPVVP